MNRALLVGTTANEPAGGPTRVLLIAQVGSTLISRSEMASPVTALFVCYGKPYIIR
jgi:hypothetical protein